MASPTSVHLTRIHDGESLEDLKPWRCPTNRLFFRENFTDGKIPTPFSGYQVVRGWEHMPLPKSIPPLTPKVGVGLAKDSDEDTTAPPPLAPHLYAALVRSVLLPWGTQPPGETSGLRAAAASELRDALGVSVDEHASALVAARRANKGVVQELNSRLNDLELNAGEEDDGHHHHHGDGDGDGDGDDDSDDDGDLTAAFLLKAEKRALEPLVSDLCSLPRFDATVHVAIIKVEGKSEPSVGEVHSAAGGAKVENVALAEKEKPEVEGAGGIFAAWCCFGGGFGVNRGGQRDVAPGRSMPSHSDADADQSAVDFAPAPALAQAVEPIEHEMSVREKARERETETETSVGQLRCALTLMSGAGARPGQTYCSTPVRCAARGDAPALHACAPQMRVSCDDAASAVIEIRVYWTRGGEAEVEDAAEEGDLDSEPVSERLAMAAGGDGSAKAMRAGDIQPHGRQQHEGEGGGGGVLLGVASLRVADLEDTSASVVPRTMRLALQPRPSGRSTASQAASPLPELTTVHVAVDCFVENFINADDVGLGGSEDTDRTSGAGHIAGENLANSCVAVVSALWAGWEQAGCSASGGPLDACLRAGMHVPTWADGDVGSNRSTTGGPVTAPRRLVIPPRGWRGVLCAFAALHRVPRATIALAEAEAIALRWHAGPEVTVISELHARLATAVSAIASGRATSADASLHVRVAAVILPRAESSLSKLLAPSRGTNADEAAMALRALTPVLALCLPLDTPAPKFANYLRRAARQAVLARVAMDLATPSPDEARATVEAAEAVVSQSGVAGIDEDSEYDIASYRGAACDVSKAAFSQIGTEAGHVASLKAAEDGRVSVSTASVAAANDSDLFTLSRVTNAVEAAVACFPVDVIVFRALPSGVSAAPIALYSAAAALMQAAREATVAAGALWAPSYGKVFSTLDTALRKLRMIMHAAGLGCAAGPLAVSAVDDLFRPSLEELLVSIRPRLASVLEKGVAREGSPTLPPTPVAPARGAMHSASLVDLFAALRDTYIAVMPASVQSRHRVRHHSAEVEAILGAALRWYASEHERDCLTEVRTARERLSKKMIESRSVTIHQKIGGKAVDGGRMHHEEGRGGSIVGNEMHGESPATLTFGFQTRLSNIHACVASLRALREDCPLLWRASSLNFSAAGEPSGDGVDNFEEDEPDDDSIEDGEESEDQEEGNYGDQVRNDDMTSNVGSTRRKLGVGADSGVTAESTSFAELLRALRCSRASVISAATELLMDIVTPYLATAVLSPDFETRHAAISRAFECIDAELSRMNSALAAGAFRLAAAAVHRAACAALERLVLHRAHDDMSIHASSPGTSLTTAYANAGGSLSGTSAPLTEVQHSRVVELTAALRDFLAVDGGGVPLQVLMDGEQRLRRLLNLWFTPTIEVVREYWRQMDIVATRGGGAAAAAAAGLYGAVGVVRPVEGAGVGPLDLIQLLAQRSGVSSLSDGEAAAVVDAQLSAAASVNAQAVLSLPPGESVVASFLCRFDKTTLAGRFFLTSSRVGFSTCGVGPDHPHDVHSAVTVPINHVVRAFKGDSAKGSSSASMILLLVDSRALRFNFFSGGARARDLALEALRTSASVSHPQAPFLVAAGALASSSSLVPLQTSHEHLQSNDNISDVPALAPGEKSRQRFSCTLLHALRDDETGTLHVTSAALLWLPNGETTSMDSFSSSGVVGLRIQYEDINLASIAMSRFGWADHVVTVGLKPKPGVAMISRPIYRFIRLTESGARALQGEIRAAVTVAADSSFLVA